MKNLIFSLILIFVVFKGNTQVPNYLSGYKDQYKENPRQANLDWFKDANFGMFIHYGLYSQLGKGERRHLSASFEG